MKSRISLLILTTFLSLLGGCQPQPPPPAFGLSPAVIEAMNRGVSLMGQYQYDDAVKAFEEVLKTSPDLIEARINLAIARFNRSMKEHQDIEKAGEILEAVLKEEPANLRAWYFKGIILQHIGQTEGAVACFEKVVQARPEDGVAWYLLGICKQRLGQPGESELLKAVELRPYLGSAYYRLFQMYQTEGETEKARPYLDRFKALRENPLNETIELPQYNQMGELALVRPLPPQPMPPITKAAYSAQPVRPLSEISEPLFRAVPPATPAVPGKAPSLPLGGAAVADFNRDGLPDMVLVSAGQNGLGRLRLLLGQSPGRLSDATAGSGLEAATGVWNCALGDFDNDEQTDLFVTGEQGHYLFQGRTNGHFRDITRQAGLGGASAGARSALFLDADHDGDLDIFVCRPSPQGNQLWNNNADGGFTNIAASAGVAGSNATSTLVLPGDLDGDRDMDLVLLCEDQPAKIFVNELLGKYREVDGGLSLRGELGGVLQDLNGDGLLDVLALGGQPARLQLGIGNGRGQFIADKAFAAVAEAAASWGAIRGFRVNDLDLDGDWDIAFFSTDGHLLFNDGAGRFVLQAQFWKSPGPNAWAGVELFDFNGDYVADLLCFESGAKSAVALLSGMLTPPPTALSISPTGIRSRDKRTRSPASGYGVVMTLRAGLREQARIFTGQSGGFSQSPLPAVFGLGGARQADYVHFLWPDGVAQVEMAMAAGQHHQVAELQRKISSCPVLFTWNGSRFEFVTDFAGVGGLGYFVAPGEYAAPQPLEHIKIEPEQLRPRQGAYELRITEPMEEAAYVDRLELLAVDHPSGWRVFPDERLVVTGPPATHELLVVKEPIFPNRAVGPHGQECAERLQKVDRLYAYEPELDRRFFGFCRPHALELDFGNQLASLPAGQRVFLFISGYLEYPYSQTSYAAAQARIGWEPIRLEQLKPDGQWQTIVADAGAFGGMARTMTVDLTGLIAGPDCRLRLSSNLEIYYDQIFLGLLQDRRLVKLQSMPVSEAELRRCGFAREHSPDGRMPLIFDYELSDASAPFHVLRGEYTRYGPVQELLEEFDNAYVLVGPGDEIAVKFDATKLAPIAEGSIRSFVLVSHAYCKDMDLYTATPQTLEPMPFHGMSRYPYPPGERFPDTEKHRRLRATYQTRLIE